MTITTKVEFCSQNKGPGETCLLGEPLCVYIITMQCKNHTMCCNYLHNVGNACEDRTCSPFQTNGGACNIIFCKVVPSTYSHIPSGCVKESMLLYWYWLINLNLYIPLRNYFNHIASPGLVKCCCFTPQWIVNVFSFSFINMFFPKPRPCGWNLTDFFFFFLKSPTLAK